MSYQYGYGGQAGNSITANQVTLSPSARTAYSGQPVILVHMILDAGTRFAACAPIIVEYVTNHMYPDVPRVACPGCLLALREANT